MFTAQGWGLDPVAELGLLAFLLLVPLAVTSTDRWVRRLGFVPWKRLHRLFYLATVCALIHFVWRVKTDLRQPIMFGVLLAGLFAVRLLALFPRTGPATGRALRKGAVTAGSSRQFRSVTRTEELEVSRVDPVLSSSGER
jgi:DMSO/TMAO reductase YedYZ heme-binding membrane subunit